MTQFTCKCYPKYTVFLKYYHYYEPIQINVVQSGNYTVSSIDNSYGAMGSLYKEHFNEFMPEERLIAHNLNGCPNREFKIITELQSSVTYILIMMPIYSHSRNNFSIVVFGPNNITFNPISKSNIKSIISSFNRYFHQIFEQHIHQN